MSSSSGQTFSTSDLRSHAKEYKRDQDDKSKWARGGVVKSGRNGHMAPVKVCARHRKSNKDMGINAANIEQRHEIFDEGRYRSTSPDSSGIEDVDEPSAAPAVDADVAYSFDARSGPSAGSQILSLALAKAVERYETTVTDNIVQKEWEMLDDTGEVLLPKSTALVGHGKKHSKRTARGSADLEADYEFV